MSAAQSEFIQEFTDYLPGAVEHFGERGYNWHDMSRADICERYLRGEFCVCVKFGYRLLEGDRKHFFAFFRQNNGAGLTESDNRWIPSAFSLGANINILPNLRALNGDNQEVVFVSDVELVNDVKSVVVRNGFTVGLCFNNASKGSLADSLYLSTVTRLFEFFSFPAYRKLVGVERPIALGLDKCNDQVVKARSELVNNLAGQNGESEGYVCSAVSLKDILTGIVIEARFDSIRARVVGEELINLGVEVLDTFIGPLKLRLDTI